MAYAIIGKQVFKDSVTKLRILNLDTSLFEDISVSDMSKFDGVIINGEYNVDSPYGILLYYQSIYDLPIFKRTGEVNTYFYKVVISINDDVLEIANITGCVKKINVNQNLISLLSLNINSLIAATPSGLVGFRYELNGDVTQFNVDERFITRLYQRSALFSYIDLCTCYYKNVPCYYFDGNISKQVSLGAVSGINKYQLLSLNKNSYSKRSFYISLSLDMNFLFSQKVVSHTYLFNGVYAYCGIDGVTFLGNDMLDIKNPALEELKERLLFTQPSLVQKIEENLRMNDLNEVLYLNLFDFEIPDTATRILNSSLYFGYSSDATERSNQYKIREIYIPKSVEFFDNNAFSMKSNQVFPEKMRKITCIVENPNIYNNVVLSSLHSKIMFKEIKTDGIVEVNLNKLKFYYSSELFKSLKTQTWGMKRYKGFNKNMTKQLVLDDLLPDKDNYAILPTEKSIKERIKSHDKYYLVYFEDTSQFIDSLEMEYNKLRTNLYSISLKIKNTDHANIDIGHLYNLKGMTGNITNMILSYLEFIQSFKVKHGDVERFNNMMIAFESLYKESLLLKKAVLSFKIKKHMLLNGDV